MTDFRFGTIRRPRNSQDVETGRTAEEAVPMQKNQGEIGQAALLSIIHGFRRTPGVLAFGGTDFDENHALAVKRHQVQLSLGTAEVLSEDAIAQATSEEPSCRPLRARAKPAPPPRFASFG